MHDIRELIAPDTEAVRRLKRRGYALDVGAVTAAHERRTAALTEVARLRADLNRVSRAPRDTRPEPGTAAAPGPAPDGDAARQAVRSLRGEVQYAEARARAAEEEVTALMLGIPNIPLDSVPDGRSEKEAVEIRRGGSPVRAIPGGALHHSEIGERLGILDSARAARLSGARFSVSRGAGARLERALASFLLDLHTSEHGYTEYAVPFLVSRETMTGTGQLPKFEEDLFSTRVGDRELFLIPTAEVPLTNLVAHEVLDAKDLPLAFVAHTPCFRAEAGSYGRDTRGILRLHQFEKVELVRICGSEEEAQQQIEVMLGHAEECLRRLGLSYRVVLLPAGDMGFSARMTYDIEVWLPGSDAYREISSVSDCGTFQARRAAVRSRTSNNRKVPAATLNGSALPIGRTVAALLETGLQKDGSVVLPDALVPYTGFRVIMPGGRTGL